MTVEMAVAAFRIFRLNNLLADTDVVPRVIIRMMVVAMITMYRACRVNRSLKEDMKIPPDSVTGCHGLPQRPYSFAPQSFDCFAFIAGRHKCLAAADNNNLSKQRCYNEVTMTRYHN